MQLVKSYEESLSQKQIKCTSLSLQSLCTVLRIFRNGNWTPRLPTAQYVHVHNMLSGVCSLATLLMMYLVVMLQHTCRWKCKCSGNAMVHFAFLPRFLSHRASLQGNYWTPWLWLANQMKAHSPDSQTVSFTTHWLQISITSFTSGRLELKMPK